MLKQTQTLRLNDVYTTTYFLAASYWSRMAVARDVRHRDAGLHVLEHLPEVVPIDRQVCAALSWTRGRVELQYIE